MKRTTFLIILLTLSIFVCAQTAQEDIKENIYRCASNLLAYPGPSKVLTVAPEGKTPFYISHYGRHGSRYLCGKNEYKSPLGVLQKANSHNKLTDLGKDVLRRVKAMADEADKRAGELTLLGAEQHRAIAKRMYERFPQVFEGAANIDAKSTIVIRCILSMENALQQFASMNPQLKIRHDASEHDMCYMNFGNDWIEKYRVNKQTSEKLNAWTKAHISSKRLMDALFNDQKYVADSLHADVFYSELFKVANINQNQETRHQFGLYDIFTEQEIYNLWEKDNIRWFLGYGGNPMNNNLPPYVQRNLLKKIISEADSCLLLEKPGATLRYGHETMVLPLTFLMELNGTGKQITDIEKITEHWQNYKFFPMAANIQIIFYRKDINDKDVLIKVLLNEDEATLPIETDCAPYYHWNEVRNYYLNKLTTFDSKAEALKAEAQKTEWARFW